MGIIDGAGLATLGGLRSHTTAAVGDQVTTPYAPADLTRYPLLTVHLQVWLATTGTANSDIQWQVASDDAFSTIVWSQTTTDQADGLRQAATSALTEGQMYWWRTRSAETGTTGWGDWSEVWRVTPDLNTGRGYAYVDVNIGIDPALDQDAVGYVDQNIGIEEILDPDAVEYVLGNHGVEITRDPDAVEYGYVGDVNTDQPTPHIWFLRPTSGRSGDGIEVVGLGFGDLQSTYSGQLQRKPGTVWEALPVTDWQTYPPTADAYTEDRVLDPLLGVIDMQHTVIAFTVPAGSEPPGWLVRVVTEEA